MKLFEVKAGQKEFKNGWIAELERLRAENKELLEAIIKVNNWACGVTDRWYACRILQEAIAKAGGK